MFTETSANNSYCHQTAHLNIADDLPSITYVRKGRYLDNVWVWSDWKKLVTYEIVPSDASASNKLVTHITPYASFTLVNDSGSQKWYKIGTYQGSNNSSRLDFVSARVDTQMFESSVRMSGHGTDNNYVSWISEQGCEVSTIAIKTDTSRNVYLKMNSWSGVEIRAYGQFTLNVSELSSEPSGTSITRQRIMIESDYVKEVGTEAAMRNLSGDHGPVSVRLTSDITPADSAVQIPSGTEGIFTAQTSDRRFFGQYYDGKIYSWFMNDNGSNVVRVIG